MKQILARAAAGLVASLILAACSSNTTSDPLDPGAQPDGTGDGTNGDTSGGGGTNGLGPSGALYRIVNVYDPLNADPGKVDVYPKAYALDDDQPLRSVDFGAASELYDPPVYEGGNMFVSLYATGTKGNGNALISKTETLKGGEVITVVLTTAEGSDDTGRRYGQVRSYFHDSPDPPIAAGRGHLVVDMLGLDNVLPEKKGQHFTVKVGGECLPGSSDTEFSKAVLAPGGQNTYALPPGSYTASVIEGDDCVGASAVENVPFAIEADGRALVVVYAARGAGYRSVSLALSPNRAP